MIATHAARGSSITPERICSHAGRAVRFVVGLSGGVGVAAWWAGV
jgi:hypothetical protein